MQRKHHQHLYIDQYQHIDVYEYVNVYFDEHQHVDYDNDYSNYHNDADHNDHTDDYAGNYHCPDNDPGDDYSAANNNASDNYGANDHGSDYDFGNDCDDTGHYADAAASAAEPGTKAAGQASREAAGASQAACAAEDTAADAATGTAGKWLHDVTAMRRFLLVPLLAAAALTGFEAPATGAASAAPAWSCQTVNKNYPPRPYVHEKPVGKMIIGVVRLNTPIFLAPNVRDVETEASKSLDKGPAFYPKYMKWPQTGLINSLPGQGGTVAMLGHRTTRTHPFCRVDLIKPGRAYITVRMRYGTFKYLVIANKPRTPGADMDYFLRPGHYDPHPRQWAKGIKPEYLVFGACDPPGSSTYRDYVVAKLVAEYGS